MAVAIAVAVSVALTFTLAAVASAIVALRQTGSLDPAGSQFPSFGHVAAALAAALTMSLAYAAVGLTLGIWLRSATAGIGAVLLWAVVVQPSIEYFAAQLHGVVLELYKMFPDAATNTVINLDGSPDFDLYGSSLAKPRSPPRSPSSPSASTPPPPSWPSPPSSPGVATSSEPRGFRRGHAAAPADHYAAVDGAGIRARSAGRLSV